MYIQKVVLNFSFQDQLGNWSVPAEKGGKMENLEEIPLAEAWQELLTNLTHMWYQVWEMNPFTVVLGGGGDCFQHQPFPALPWYFFNILGLYQDDLYITKWNNTTIIILVWANFSKANIEFSTTPGYSAIVYERQRKNSLTLDLH